MNLGIFLSPGESFTQMKQSGQDVRFIETYLKIYAPNFKKIYVFSYANEKVKLPVNIVLVPNTTGFHRLIYALCLPIIHGKKIKECDVIRGFGLVSSLSAFFLAKPFVFNWAYDYVSFVKLQEKIFYAPLYFILEALAFLKAKKVFIATKSKFNRLNGKKFVYLPNGVDTKLFKPTTHLQKGLVFVGRFEKQKNLPFLITSLSFLPKQYREITFIGQGSLVKEYVSLANKKKIRLHIIPPVANNKLPQILAQFSIFLLCSFHEGSPKVLLEAMAAGLVPVVTNFPTAKEVINNGQEGFITNFDQKDFASKVQLLLSDEKLYRKMSRNAVSRIKRKFDQNKLIEKEISVLKNV